MFVIDIIPIARGIPRESLTYFSHEELKLGVVIPITIRNKSHLGIVTAVRPALSDKMSIKQADFELRKIEKVKKSIQLFLPTTIEAAVKTSNRIVAPAGQIISSITPACILSKNPSHLAIGEIKKNDGLHLAEKHLLQSPDDERVLEYKSLIRESFAQKKSVLITSPTIEHAERLKEELMRGIENYVIVFHSDVKQNEIIDNWIHATNEKHPLLIISTAGFLALPCTNIGTIIIDRENNRSYKQMSHPYLDGRVFAETLAEEIGARLIIGDTAPRVETMYRAEQGSLLHFPTSKSHIPTTAKCMLVNMCENKAGQKISFSVFSHTMLEQISATIEKNERVFLYVTRKGLAPSTVCHDCGETVLCNSCGSSVVLHKGSVSNHFLCHRCGERRNATEVCKKCHGWNLIALGIGIETVLEALKEKFPNTSIFSLEKETSRTPLRARKVVREFLATHASILVGTEYALPFLPRRIECTGIVSLDSLFAIPDYRINEKVFSLISAVRSIARDTCVVQTRATEQTVITSALRGTSTEFYRDEIQKRRAFSWPPFMMVVKISVTEKKSIVSEMMRSCTEFLSDYEIEVFPAFIPAKRERHTLHAILKIPFEQWPDNALIEKLKTLPDEFEIEVDPEQVV